MALDTKHSVVDLMKSLGMDSSMSNRKVIAKEAGIKNYNGSYDQNIQLYNYVSSGASSGNKNNNVNSTPVTTVNNGTPTSANPTTPSVKGADSSLVDKATSSFAQSDESANADKAKEKALESLGELTGKENIVSQETWDTINSSFSIPGAVVECDAWLNGQLSKIQSGKTSYSDDVRAMIEKIQNRDKFSYDVDKDQLFQQALASAMGSGKQAMQDTIGQASALTGGYGSTYATSAGNQAYNAFIEDAYNNLPQYYQMAFDAYQAEGQDMYQQLSMLSEADAREYERLLTAYDATYQHRNQMYNEAYTAYRDTKSDAFASANLQINEHGQLVSDAYNYYNATADYADTIYAREWDNWQNEVNTSLALIGYQNGDYWKSEDLAESRRQHDEDMDYKYESLNYSKERDNIEDGRYITENDWNGDGKVDVKDKQAQAMYEQGDLNLDGVISDEEKAYLNDVNGGKTTDKPYSLSNAEITKLEEIWKNTGSIDAVYDHLELIGKSPETPEEVAIVEKIYSKDSTSVVGDGTINWRKATFQKTTDTINWFWGEDGDDIIKVDGREYRMDELEDAMREDGMTEAEIETILKKVGKLNLNGTYKYS